MKKVLIIDNYDSFTYNLVQLVEEVVGIRPTVIRNDALQEIDMASFSHVILSPGPGLPNEAGDLNKTIAELAQNKVPTLGVCLGQQAIAEHFGGSLSNLAKVYHGVSDPMDIIKEDALFADINTGFEAGRYHSWIVNRTGFPSSLEVLCEGPKKEIMALRHRSLPMVAVQFHPESILTPSGKQLISNFLTAIK